MRIITTTLNNSMYSPALNFAGRDAERTTIGDRHAGGRPYALVAVSADYFTVVVGLAPGCDWSMLPDELLVDVWRLLDDAGATPEQIERAGIPVPQGDPEGEFADALENWWSGVSADLDEFKRGEVTWRTLFDATAVIDMRAEYDPESHVLRVDWMTSDCNEHVWGADTLKIAYRPGIFDGDDEPLAELDEQWRDVRRAMAAGDTAPGLYPAVEADGRRYLELSDDEPMSVDDAFTAMGW